MPKRNQAALDFLLTRRSRPAKTLSLPTPDQEQLRDILTAALRTPDHGKLEPWRLIVLTSDSLDELASIAEACALEAQLDASAVEKARQPFDQGHVAVAVIEVQKPSEKIPTIEQTYSAGAVCLALLNAALAAGWGANWLSGWASHNRSFVENGLGLSAHERVAGLIYLGTETKTPPERPRPNLEQSVTWR
jgi:nitroreductase